VVQADRGDYTPLLGIRRKSLGVICVGTVMNVCWRAVFLLGKRSILPKYLYPDQKKTNEYPTYLLIGLTNLCTTLCKFCYRRDLDLRPAFFPVERYESLIDELGPHLDILEFSGIGEPLLHKDFRRFVLYTRRKFGPGKLTLRLVSNGSLLGEQMRRFLVHQSFGQVWFSVNAATIETYSKIMPHLDFDGLCKSVYELVALRNILGLRVPHVHLSFVVTRDNYFEAEKFVDLAFEMGADSISIRPLDKELNPRIFWEQQPPKEEFDPILERIEDRTRQDKRVWCAPRWGFFPKAYQETRDKSTAISCGNAENTFRVYFTSGEVTFCCYMAAEIENEINCLGNIYDSSALEIWNGPRAQAFRRSMKDIRAAPDICLRCSNFWNKEWVCPSNG